MRVWVGVDAGKEHHWAAVLDENGQTLLSRRFLNDEQAIVQLVNDIDDIGEQVTWAMDMSTGYVALLLAVLWHRGKSVNYVSGRAMNRASDGYRSEGKTDAKDARIIADQARLRRDFASLTPQADLLTDLSILVTHRRDLATDRQRMVVRLRERLASVFPALERALDVTTKGALVLLTRWQTPDAIRNAGESVIAAHLRGTAGIRVHKLTQAAMTAAQTQTVSLPGEQTTAAIVARLARELLRLRDEINQLDADLEQRFRSHAQADVLTSLPGMGTLLAAEFLVAVGDIANFTDADHLAAYAGLAPVPRDSGRRSGNLQRPHRYNRALMRVFYTSAMVAAGRPGPSRDYYQRKRTEGKRHIQAVMALARRRVNVMWAMLRDAQPYTEQLPKTAPQT
ncbi:IS110 family transposase [Micromonospora globbae]|nr:IS110 family transposase [Micromonospora globbae]